MSEPGASGPTGARAPGLRKGPLALLLGLGAAVVLVVWALSPGPRTALAETTGAPTTRHEASRSEPERPVTKTREPPPARALPPSAPATLDCAQPEAVAATIDGVALTTGTVCEALARVAGPGAGADAAVRGRFGPRLLERLIDDRLVAREAERLGVRVGDGAIEDEVARLVRERGAIASPSLRGDVADHLLRLALVRREVVAPTQAEVEAAYAARPEVWAAVDDDGARAIRPFAIVAPDVRRALTLERERAVEEALLVRLRGRAAIQVQIRMEGGVAR